MGLEDRAKATIQNIEGKTQEIIGEVTGNPKDTAEGQAKQDEAAARHSVENVKDELKQAID